MIDYKIKEEFLEYYLKYNDSLTKFVKAMTRNSSDTKDIISETVLLALENFHKLKNKQTFLSYVFTIAKRIYIKRKWKKKIFSYIEESDNFEYSSNSSSPEVDTDINFLYEALAKLPEKMRESIILFEISGFSLNEIQEIQGGTLSGVKSRIKRAREKLREILTSEKYEEPKVSDKYMFENDYEKDYKLLVNSD